MTQDFLIICFVLLSRSSDISINFEREAHTERAGFLEEYYRFPSVFLHQIKKTYSSFEKREELVVLVVSIVFAANTD